MHSLNEEHQVRMPQWMDRETRIPAMYLFTRAKRQTRRAPPFPQGRQSLAGLSTTCSCIPERCILTVAGLYRRKPGRAIWIAGVCLRATDVFEYKNGRVLVF